MKTDEDERLIQRSSRVHARRRGLLVLFVMILAAVLAIGALVRMSPKTSLVIPGRHVTVTIPNGASLRGIASQLQKAGVIGDPAAFQKVAEEKGVGSALRPGTYKLVTGTALPDLVGVLAKGPPPPPFSGIPLVIPEGFTVKQIAERLVSKGHFSSKAVAAALADRSLTSKLRPPGKSLEGLLFPATYAIAKNSKPVTVLKAMLAKTSAVLAQPEIVKAKPKTMSNYQLLTIASLVEREALRDVDRPKVARVILNRLAAGQTLGLESTVRYALQTTDASPLKQSQIKIESPYNTYIHAGLPPGPIASPGLESILAVLHPAPGNWLYFVQTAKDGTESFTASYQEFLNWTAKAKAEGVFK